MNRFDIKISHILLSSVCTYAVVADLGAYPTDWADGFDYYVRNLLTTKVDPMVSGLILVLMIPFVRYIRQACFPSGKRNIPVTILSYLFGLFTVVGTSFHIAGNSSLIVGVSNGQMLKAILWYFSLVVLYYYLLSWLFLQFNLLDWKEHRSEPTKVFGLTFLILCLAYIPYTIASYPAIFNWDECNQILSTHPELGIVAPGYLNGHLLNEHVYLNEHHPLAHTLLLKVFIDAGQKWFHSANLGVFVQVLFQMLFVFSAISYLISTLSKYRFLSKKMYIALLCYFILVPRINNYMMVTAKDVIYAACLIYFTCFLFQIMTDENRHPLLFVGTGVSSLGLFLFRNEGRYLLVFTFLFILIMEKGVLRKTAITGLIGTVVLTVVLSSVILPHFNVNKGSKREMLSVPFQQTARYVTEFGDEVTDHEKQVIDHLLKYDTIPERYDPNRSDSIKNCFNENTTAEDLISYVKVWGKMGLKHPGCYIGAFVNNYYQYYWPGDTRLDCRGYEFTELRFADLSAQMEPIGYRFYYPDALNGFRNGYESLREAIAHYAPVSIFDTPVFYTWVLIILLAYCIYKRNRGAFLLQVYPLGVLIMCNLSPCNGYFARYQYPDIMALPALLLFAILLTRRKIEPSGGNELG